MANAETKTLNTAGIPVINLQALRDGTGVDKVAAAMHSASQNLGFIYVSGHGIESAVIDQTRAVGFEFFRSDQSLKETVLVSQQHRGWLAPGQSKMSDDARVDLKESFIWGFENADGQTPNDHALRGANQWPANLTHLKTHTLEYFKQAHGVAFDLMRGFARGLDLDENFFLQSIDKPLSRGSLVYYPPQDESLGRDQFGVSPHTDFGVLTLLCQDDVGGLEVQDLNGDWIAAPPIPDTLVVNVGDLLSRWTDGEYRSTPHRVVNRSGRERLSLVLAFDPNPETKIDARDIFGADHEAQQEAITCGDYLIWRFGKAFAYRQKTAS